jgi:hypothetical protein
MASFALDPSTVAAYQEAKKTSPVATVEEVLLQNILINQEEAINGIITICKQLAALGAPGGFPTVAPGGGSPGHRIAWPNPTIAKPAESNP